MNQVNAVTIGSSGHWLGSVRQKGQSMVEYMVVIAALVFALHTSGAIDELIDVLKKKLPGLFVRDIDIRLSGLASVNRSRPD